jgi:UDP-2-acetamido-3-amino-2,3-dideoxy-glucuronate N-acetyltransferase
MSVRIHPTAEVSGEARLGEGTSIWHHSQIRPGAVIGENCILGKGVYVDSDVNIGSNVKIQNYVSVYHGVCIEDGVFIGPHVCFTNDMRPRSINADGTLKGTTDWVVSKTLIKRGASLGANSTIRCGITIGDWAMIGSGSVVTRDVPAHGLVYGNPARLHGFCCPCGTKLEKEANSDGVVQAVCPDCGARVEISTNLWESVK